LKLDVNYRPTVANMMSHSAIVREVYKTKPRSLHNQSIVFETSTVQPVSIRAVRPVNRKAILAMDEIRKKNAQGFDRRGRCKKTKQLRTLPIMPKIKMTIAK
jgi:hypothetical protein